MTCWKLKLLAMCASILFVAVLAFAKPGVVTTSDGNTLEGDIYERNTDVLIRRHGVDTVIQRDQIVSIDYDTFEERFHKQLAELDPSDSEGRIRLAREAYQQREYVLALEAIDEAILIDPVNMQARDLAGVIRRQAQIEAGKPRPENSNSESTATTEPAYQNPRASLMSDDQINRIRLMEMRKGDKQMRISFRAEVRQRYIEKHPPMTFRQFNAQSKLDQALEIRDRGSADMLDDLRIMNDPPALELFTNRIEPALVRGCATSRCHGGPNGGDFRLIAPSTNREIKYTNYHIIMNYSRLVETESTSVFSTPIVDMVRRGESAKSLLTQYSLPRSKTSLQHPDVQNFSPLIHDVDQPLYQDMVRWMDSLLQPIAPEYGFDFSYQFKTRGDETSIDESSDGSTTDESMVDDSTTEPSTQPTSEPAAE